MDRPLLKNGRGINVLNCYGCGYRDRKSCGAQYQFCCKRFFRKRANFAAEKLL